MGTRKAGAGFRMGPRSRRRGQRRPGQRRWPAQCTVEAELGAVKGQGGVKEVGSRLRQRLDRLEHLDGPGRAGQASSLADVIQVQAERPEGLRQGSLRVPEPLFGRGARFV
jgi:hypothetical protein